MMRIDHVFDPDTFPKNELIDETDFYYYHYVGDISFQFDEGKISVHYVTLGDVCVQLRDICQELEKGRDVKQLLEFTEGEGVITFERQGETVFIHPEFITSENSPFTSPAPEDYGFRVPYGGFYNEVKRFYSCVAEVIRSSNDCAKEYLVEWE